MARRILVLVVLLITAGSVFARVQNRGLPVSGSVLTAAGLPVAGASVRLVRHTWREGGQNSAEGHQTLAQATTDEQGGFSFGTIDLKTEMAFPLETGLQLEYQVFSGGRERRVGDVAFTAPRNDDYSLRSVSAKITVY